MHKLCENVQPRRDDKTMLSYVACIAPPLGEFAWLEHLIFPCISSLLNLLFLRFLPRAARSMPPTLPRPMYATSIARLGVLAVAAMLAGLAAGCSDEEQHADPEKIENLRVIQEAYMKACQDLKRPPASRDELIKYLPPNTDVQAVFRSQNDGQEYVIIWGSDPFAPFDFSGTEPKPLVIGYEKEGKDGVRFVFLATGVQQLTAERFANANFPPGHQP